MRFVIHMGNYKTGSTALQNYLYQNAEQLANYRIFYGQTDPAPLCSHASFTYSLLRMTLQHMGLFHAYEPHPIYQYISQSPNQILEQIIEDADTKHCETILLSHEAIFCEAWRTLNGLRNIPNLGQFSEEDILKGFHQNLYDLLCSVSQEIRAVIYLRRQDDYLESQYNQYIKAPWWEETIQLPDFTEFMSLHPVTLDYRKPLEIIRKIYGIKNMTVLAYNKHSHLQDDFITQILRLPSDSLQRFKQPEAAMENRSISHDIIDFKCKFLSPDAACNPTMQTWLTEYSTLHPDPQDYTYFTPEIHKQFIKKYDCINPSINDVYMREDHAIPALDSSEEKALYSGITPENLHNLVNFLSSHP